MSYQIIESEIKRAIEFMVMTVNRTDLPLSEIYKLDLDTMERIGAADAIIRLVRPMYDGIDQCRDLFRAYETAKKEFDKFHWNLKFEIAERLEK